MKLLTQTTLSYLIITLLAFGIGGVYIYQILQKEVDQETDWYLIERLEDIYGAIEKGAPIESLTNEDLQISLMEPEHPEIKAVYADTLRPHPYTKQIESYRKVEVVKEIEGKKYYVKLVDLVIESQDITDGVFRSLSRVFGVLALVFVLANLLLYRWLLRPFDNTLRKIRHFRLQDPSPLDLSPSFTSEFNQLNNFLQRMTGKMQEDYRNLKEFTENASHEMQTPLAIAKGKLELLLEDMNLSEEQLQKILAAYNSINKLSRMGRSLSLLTKIQNREFVDREDLNLTLTVENLIYDFQELFSLKTLSLHKELEENVPIYMDSNLLDMLLTNLLQNAVRHNVENGEIAILLQERELVIRNTGPAPQVDPALLFHRFKKSNQSAESLGLGLAIVDKICAVSQLSIDYEYEEGWHSFRLSW
ncbi:MAG: HAMP domain-containing sensor histidine kinase [Bacteroidota bacterium]